MKRSTELWFTNKIYYSVELISNKQAGRFDFLMVGCNHKKPRIVVVNRLLVYLGEASDVLQESTKLKSRRSSDRARLLLQDVCFSNINLPLCCACCHILQALPRFSLESNHPWWQQITAFVSKTGDVELLN